MKRLLAHMLKPSDQNGDVLTTVSGKAAWAPPTGGGGGGSTVAAAQVWRDAAFSIQTNTLTTIPFTVADSDTLGFWDSQIPTRLTVPAGYGGLYQVAAAIGYSSPNGVGSERSLNLTVNGGIYASTDIPPTTAGGSWASPTVSILAPLADGDYITLDFYQNSGVPISLRILNPRRHTWLSVTRVAD